MEKIKNFIKSYWKTTLFFALVGLFGGFFTGLYLMDSYPAQVQQLLLDQGINSPHWSPPISSRRCCFPQVTCLQHSCCWEALR